MHVTREFRFSLPLQVCVCVCVCVNKKKSRNTNTCTPTCANTVYMSIKDTFFFQDLEFEDGAGVGVGDGGVGAREEVLTAGVGETRAKVSMQQ